MCGVAVQERVSARPDPPSKSDGLDDHPARTVGVCAGVAGLARLTAATRLEPAPTGRAIDDAGEAHLRRESPRIPAVPSVARRVPPLPQVLGDERRVGVLDYLGPTLYGRRLLGLSEVRAVLDDRADSLGRDLDAFLGEPLADRGERPVLGPLLEDRLDQRSLLRVEHESTVADQLAGRLAELGLDLLPAEVSERRAGGEIDAPARPLDGSR